MNIYVESEEAIKKEFAEAVYLLYQLRSKTKIWERVFGYPAKFQKQKFEKEADKFLERLLGPRDPEECPRKAKVEIKPPEQKL